MDCKKIKSKIIAHCKALLEDKVLLMEQELKLLAQDVAGDTKSSAGDKFETGREMTNAEREKIFEQVILIKKQLELLSGIENNNTNTVGYGNLVETDRALIFISISLGIVEFDTQKVMVISPLSPLAQALTDAKTGESPIFMKVTYKIKSIC